MEAISRQIAISLKGVDDVATAARRDPLQAVTNS
jgi:hypothetical protein